VRGWLAPQSRASLVLFFWITSKFRGDAEDALRAMEVYGSVRRELIEYKNYLDTYVTISILEIIFIF